MCIMRLNPAHIIAKCNECILHMPCRAQPSKFALQMMLDTKAQMGCQTGESVAKHAQDCILRLRAWHMNRIVRLA